MICCAYCGRDISRRGTARPNPIGPGKVCRISCSWIPYHVDIEETREANDAS